MCCYNRQTGLKPIGPHRNYADELLSKVLHCCPACNGAADYEKADGALNECPPCNGRGVVPPLTDPRVQEALRRIEARYPGACTSGTLVVA